MATAVETLKRKMKEQNWREQTPSISLQLACLPMGTHSLKCECWGESSVFKLHMGVATCQFKWASQKVRGAEWEWRKGSCATLERWRWHARAPGRWSEWKRVSLGNVHHTYNFLKGDGSMMKAQL